MIESLVLNSVCNSKRKVLKWLLELAVTIGLESLDTWSSLEIVRVVKATNVFALFANVIEFVDRDDILGILFKSLEVEFSLKGSRIFWRNWLAYLLVNWRGRSWARVISHWAGLHRLSVLNFPIYISRDASLSASFAIKWNRPVSLSQLISLESFSLGLSILMIFLSVSAGDIDLLAILFGCLGICIVFMSLFHFMLLSVSLYFLIFMNNLIVR